MSFRYTSSLIGTLKHRILLEQSRRAIASRTFVGHCDGIVVEYTAYGSVRKIRAASPEAERSFKHAEGSMDVGRLQQAIKAAVWDANRQLKSAKEEGYRTSFLGNEQIKADDDFRVWFEHDATTLRPFAYEALHEEEATPAIRQLRADRPADPISVSSTDKTLAPALMELEDETQVMRSQRRQLCIDEQQFWRRVELIRKGQTSTIRGTKRKYPFEKTEQPGSATSTGASETVSLKFVG